MDLEPVWKRKNNEQLKSTSFFLYSCYSLKTGFEKFEICEDLIHVRTVSNAALHTQITNSPTHTG